MSTAIEDAVDSFSHVAFRDCVNTPVRPTRDELAPEKAHSLAGLPELTDVLSDMSLDQIGEAIAR